MVNKVLQSPRRYSVAALLLSLLPVAGAWWLATHKLQGIGPIAVGILGLVAMFALFLTGMPVAFALMATGLVFSGCIRGMQATFNL